MKKILALGLLGISTSLMAMYGEQSYLYKDNRIMGMGGTNVAVGGYSTSIFYNPAGLRNLRKEDGFIVDLLNLQVSATEQFSDFYDDFSNAMDIENDAEKTKALIDVLEKYNGEHFHANLTNYTSISKNSDVFAWSVGLLAGADINYMTHIDGGSFGPSFETTSRAYGGVVIGAAKDFNTKIGKFDVGLGVKYITQKSYEGVIPLIDLINKETEDLQDEYEKDSSGLGVDIGLTYYPLPNNYWHPAFGLSVLNIGDIDMDNNYGKQYMTVNIGASVTPEVKYIEKLVIAVDYVDLFNNQKTRYYVPQSSATIGGTTKSKAVDVESDVDFTKNLRLGVMADLYNSSWFDLTLSGGMYQGYWTAGVDMTLAILKLSFASYEEDLGYGSYDLSDRRYSLQLGIGW
jgi:hypothetical protein